MSVHMRKNNETYFVNYQKNGKRTTKSFGKGPDAKRAAEAFDLEIKAKLKRGDQTPTFTQDVYFNELAQYWINAKKAQGVKGQWLKDWVNIMNKNFLVELSRVPIDMLTQNTINQIINDKYEDCAQITRNRYVSYLKVMFNFGLEQELIKRNPLARWKKGKEEPRQPQLTYRKLKKIMSKAEPHVKWAIRLAFKLGVRTGPSELLSLKWTDIDWQKKEINVYATKTKTWRSIPVTDMFLRELEEQMRKAKSLYMVEYRGKPVKSIRKSFKTACIAAGFEDEGITMYDIRHLACTTMLSKGGDPSSVSKIMGHSSTKMTLDTYSHPSKREMVRATKLLPNI